MTRERNARGHGAHKDGGRVLPFRPAAAATSPPPLRRDPTPVRRHRGRRIRHSQLPLALRLVRPFTAAFAIVGVPVLLTWWIFRSPVFALGALDVEIEGAGRVSDAWVRDTLRPVQGWNLPRLPLDWVDRQLRRHPWIAATALTKELPDRLGVRVVERREVALMRAEEGEAPFWYLDEEGEPIAPYETSDGEVDLPLVSAAASGGDLRPALALFDEIEDVGPPWAGGLSEIEMLGDEDFRLWSSDLPFPLLVRSGTLARKTPFLEDLLPEIERRYDDVEAVDLRFARRIILQPSVRAATDVHQRGLGG